MPAAPDTPTHELTADKTLRIKYADRWTIAWKCVLDDNNNVTDLLPARNGLPDGDQAPYTTYPLASFPSLENVQGSALLSDVAADAVRAFHARPERAGEDIQARAARLRACRQQPPDRWSACTRRGKTTSPWLHCWAELPSLR